MLTTTLQLAGRRVHLVLKADDCGSCSHYKVHKPVDVLTFLASDFAQAVYRDGVTLADLRTLAAASSSLYGPHRVSDFDIVQQIALLLKTGRILAIECRPPVEERSVKPERASAPINPRASLPRPRVREEVPTKTWVEIELVDATGKPLANQKYRIRLPDGEFHEGALDAKGRARFTELDPGHCDISFPEIDGREWKEA